MYRSHTCGELRIENVGKSVTLAGWVQKSRKLGGMTFVDLRDRYGITQLVVDAHAAQELQDIATSLGREWVLQVTGEVIERQTQKVPESILHTGFHPYRPYPAHRLFPLRSTRFL